MQMIIIFTLVIIAFLYFILSLRAMSGKILSGEGYKYVSNMMKNEEKDKVDNKQIERKDNFDKNVLEQNRKINKRKKYTFIGSLSMLIIYILIAIACFILFKLNKNDIVYDMENVSLVITVVFLLIFTFINLKYDIKMFLETIIINIGISLFIIFYLAFSLSKTVYVTKDNDLIIKNGLSKEKISISDIEYFTLVDEIKEKIEQKNALITPYFIKGEVIDEKGNIIKIYTPQIYKNMIEIKTKIKTNTNDSASASDSDTYKYYLGFKTDEERKLVYGTLNNLYTNSINKLINELNYLN